MNQVRAFSGRAMLRRAPLALVSGRRRTALRSDQPAHSRVAAPLSLIFRRAQLGSRPSPPAITARDGGTVILAPRLSFVLNLFETLAPTPARDSRVQTFDNGGMSGSKLPVFAASIKTRGAASIAGIHRAGRLSIGTRDVNVARGPTRPQLDHRSAQAGVQTLFAHSAKAAAPLRRAMTAYGTVRERDAVRGQLHATPIPPIGTPQRGSMPFSYVQTSVAPASAWFRPRINALGARTQSVTGNRHDFVETRNSPAKRYREATEIASRVHPVTGGEKFRSVTEVTLTYRTSKAESPIAMPPQLTRSEPPLRPAIDAERLGREIWQQMGRRLRIERERRGKM